MRLRASLCWLSLLPLAGQEARDPGPIAIRGARIVPVKGAVLEEGTVLMHRGFIKAVGARVDLPPGTWVIEGKGLSVYPGMVDALCDLGFPAPPAAPQVQGRGQTQSPPPPVVKGPQDRPASTPWIQAADEFKAEDKRFEQWRNGGFTAVFTGPKTGLLPGQGAVLLTAGPGPAEMVLKAGAGVLVSFQPQPGYFPASLMGVHAYLRQTFEEARRLPALRQAAAGFPDRTPVPPHDRVLNALAQALESGSPVLLPATTPIQRDRALRLAADFGLRPVLYGGQQAYGWSLPGTAPVILNAKWPAKDKDGDPDAEESLRTLRFRDRAPSSAAALEKAGISFAFSSGEQAPGDFLKAVRKAVDAGLSREGALRALTLAPAEILGVAGRMGSLEPGKLANLLLVKGDLLEEGAKIQAVFVSGEKFEVPDKPDKPDGPPRERRGRRPSQEVE